MQSPLQVSFHQIDHSDAVEDFVEKKVEKLERYCDRIIGCKVAVDRPPHHHHKGNPFHVRLEVSVPGDTIVINRDPGDREAHGDVYVVLRDAFDAAQRKLEDYARMQRDHRA